jgi:hypothetical protein
VTIVRPSKLLKAKSWQSWRTWISIFDKTQNIC